jgi:proteasome beta subunit
MKNERIEGSRLSIQTHSDEIRDLLSEKLKMATNGTSKDFPHLKTGTTTVGLKVKDGVCLATDNRATMGYLIADKHAKKLHKITDYMYLTIAGGVADAQYLIGLLRAEIEIYTLKNGFMKITQAAKLLQNILYNNKGEYEVGLILGGYTELDGPKIYDIEGYGSMLDENYTSSGSGSLYAYGVLETEWREDLSVEEGMKICMRAVRSAIIRDVFSGNGIDIVAISKSGVVEKSYSISDPEVL